MCSTQSRRRPLARSRPICAAQEMRAGEAQTRRNADEGRPAERRAGAEQQGPRVFLPASGKPFAQRPRNMQRKRARRLSQPSHFRRSDTHADRPGRCCPTPQPTMGTANHKGGDGGTPIRPLYTARSRPDSITMCALAGNGGGSRGMEAAWKKTYREARLLSITRAVATRRHAHNQRRKRRMCQRVLSPTR